MNELLEQFLVESRELVAAAMDDLLALEKSPDDAERFDSALRAIHTLKGGAGIVEFAAMQRAMHHTEDLLAAARKRSAGVSALDISNGLLCLDQVLQWLEIIERTGALPADADTVAAIARFERAQTDPTAPTAGAPTGQSTGGAWLDQLLRRHSAAVPRALTAVRYVPDGDCFFRQQDPVALIAALPGLLAVDVTPRSPWPTLDELDPFACNLVITALLAAAPAEASVALGDESRSCDVVSVTSLTAPEPFLQRAHEVLEAQLMLLGEGSEVLESGLIASAGVAAANVLRCIGRTTEADGIAALSAAAAAQRAPQRLRQAIAAALAGEAVATAAVAPVLQQDSQVQTLRVRADRIDALVKLTGEITVAKNAIGHAVKLAENEASTLASTLKDRHAALERLVGELQQSVLGMRVLPLRIAFQRFPRLVREMSVDLAKPVNLVIEGDDTEADKAIVEVLVEPLVHVLRNAMDHGIEDAAARAAAGKPPVATIRLRARRQAEHVVLEVTDDGRGIDLAEVRRVAMERNVVTADALGSMTEAELLDLIFVPGFSTAAAVTALSGRGIGMDAVRTAVSRLGGRVHTSSAPGRGTTIHFTLPFSVMMTQVMTVEAGGQMFGIPLDAVVETIRVPRERILPVGAALAIVLRDKTIPLVRLGGILGTGGPADGGDDAPPIVVANVNGELGALQVDRVGERMEIMLKPLDGLLAGLPGIAGSTLLGDGSVLLVLDVAEVLQ
jgi:two-component system chemotaxis sensor kinase CheA